MLNGIRVDTGLSNRSTSFFYPSEKRKEKKDLEYEIAPTGRLTVSHPGEFHPLHLGPKNWSPSYIIPYQAAREPRTLFPGESYGYLLASAAA